MKLLLLCGDQLFPLAHVRRQFGTATQVSILMVEEQSLCGRRRYHQQKLTLVLSAMRHHARALERAGYAVHYYPLERGYTLRQALGELAGSADARRLHGFELQSRGQASWVRKACQANGLSWQAEPSPMFLTSNEAFQRLAGQRMPLQMGRFYQAQRRRLNVLLDRESKPLGGQWSFDAQNRSKWPGKPAAPQVPVSSLDAVGKQVAQLIAERFSHHPGHSERLWLPVTRRGALRWLQRFLTERFVGFGTYEDAISTRSAFLFHSALSPLLNIGLLTPAEVLERTLAYANANPVPMNDVEGFVRQLIGWREFTRGVYQAHGSMMSKANARSAQRQMRDSWQRGALGIPPFDQAIDQLHRLGWNHHIERLMVIANLMNLAEIKPTAVYEFFMSYYVDAYEWVMVPNVYGMGLTSDDNTFATKPYICGSNYWLKMSDYGKGQWCDVVDGLYWRFVDRHKKELSSNPRTSMMVRNLNRLSGERRAAIGSAAENFLSKHTLPGHQKVQHA